MASEKSTMAIQTTPVRIAIVGLGQRGLQHLSLLWKLQSESLVQITALVDAHQKNLTAQKICQYVDNFSLDDIHVSTDFLSVLELMSTENQVDAIYFALPPGVHQGEIVAAATSGLHIFTEKPMSLSLDQAIQMEKAIRESGVISTVGFQQRYDPRYQAAQIFLQNKKLVMMTMIHNSTLEGHSVKHTPTENLGGPSNRVWAANFEWSGSTIVEAGIHQVDLMRYWGGDIDWVSANYVERDSVDILNGGDNPYAYQVTFGFKSGAVGNLLMSRLRQVSYSDSYNSILWTNGHMKFEGRDAVVYYGDPQNPRHVLPTKMGVSPDELINRAFIYAIQKNDQKILKSSFSDSMNSLATVLGANQSHLQGGKRLYLDDLVE